LFISCPKTKCFIWLPHEVVTFNRIENIKLTV
jgi:hypothetical protein